MSYQPALIEKKWQHYWEEKKIFQAKLNEGQKKKYILDMFPYPSGDGLHVGHIEGYTATDIYARFQRMRGYNVLHAIGWDAFGLPAEQYAIRTGQQPTVTTAKNIANFKRQIQSMGFSYDWSREFSTTDPNYFRWTQWIFLKLYERGLAYQSDAMVNWCPELRAVLANEEVKEGVSEIGAHPVIRMPLRQWMLKITQYADRLLEDLDGLDWPKPILEMQKHWIGKSFGAKVSFALCGMNDWVTDRNIPAIEVFTTRPDTLFGATFMVLAPEHPLVQQVVHPNAKAGLMEYLQVVNAKSERDRINDGKDKSGYFLQAFAQHPLTKEPIPIWVADYVLYGYGTGAIMAVPAHDERDYHFAQKYQLPIKQVVAGNGQALPFAAHGTIINSDFLNDLPSEQAIEKVVAYLQEQGLGTKSIHYKLRDWIFSRQRYWGEPIPVLLDEQKNAFPLDDNELPLLLPPIDSYEPSDNGESPLSKLKDWVQVHKQGQDLFRETNTMPQWAGSCWYYLRFVDPTNQNEPFSKKAENYWMPVDLYVGGAEHAVLHLLYARFWHKVLYDCGLVHTKEPFAKLVNQGIILGEDGVKMSKSRGNVVNPDTIIQSYGADTLRLYEMMLGPLEKGKPWQSGAIEGGYRFLNRVWNWVIDEKGAVRPAVLARKPTVSESKLLHNLIYKITNDIESLKLNTAISALMIFVRDMQNQSDWSKEVVETFILLISPFAPHMAEELWQKFGHHETLAYEPWPQYDPKLLEQDEIDFPIQINGKTRVVLKIDAQMEKDAIVALAKQQKVLLKHLQGKQIKKVIFVPKKIMNLIVA